MRIFTREKDFYKSLAKLAIPIAMQNIVTFMLTFTDNVMVGKLGETAISGVYIGNQLQLMLQLIVSGFESIKINKFQ